MFSSLLVLVLYQPHSPPSSLPPNSQLQSPVPGSPLSGWPVDRDKVLKLEPCRASLYRLGRFERRRSPLFPLSSVPGRLLLPSFFLCVVGLVCVYPDLVQCVPPPLSLGTGTDDAAASTFIPTPGPSCDIGLFGHTHTIEPTCTHHTDAVVRTLVAGGGGGSMHVVTCV